MSSRRTAPPRPAGRPDRRPLLSPAARAFVAARVFEMAGAVLGCVGLVLMLVIGSYSSGDPSWNSVAADGGAEVANLLGRPGAWLADLLMQTLGWASWLLALLPVAWGWRLAAQKPVRRPFLRLGLGLAGVLTGATAFAGSGMEGAPLDLPGGSLGVVMLHAIAGSLFGGPAGHCVVGTGATVLAVLLLFAASGLSPREWLGGVRAAGALAGAAGRAARDGAAAVGRQGAEAARAAGAAAGEMLHRGTPRFDERAPRFDDAPAPDFEEPTFGDRPAADMDTLRAPRRDAATGPAAPVFEERAPRPVPVVAPAAPAAAAARPPAPAARPGTRQASLHLEPEEAGYELPPIDLLQPPAAAGRTDRLDEDALRANAEKLEGVLSDFGVRGAVQKVHPGPVVTLYELEPAPGTKSSRVIGLADDIARTMSVVSVRVAVVPGRNVIGIELPNARRETVLLRELLAADPFERSQGKLALALGKDIGGHPVVADLARFPHLLVAGTTGSGKSVAINTMILSLLYRLPPDRCRFIMIDPKMLELSVYEGIPHLLAPVVTDPRKAVVALKWTVREMEDRYRNMSKLGVRNIEGYNARLREARANGESLTRRVQTGFDPDTGKPLFEEQPLDLTELPYIVVIVDEMADLMLVAGKDIEAAIQRLAQMARAAGIHLIMATQRPSVDVITGTIKANFPTRISFQVTSKIDSRTILGEQGAEQLLGQGDMLYMAGGGRITRVHGPFVSDGEVEQVVKFLKSQGEPSYVDAITEEDEDGDGGGDDSYGSGAAGGGSGDELYDKAVAIVCRERKASTSFIQRQLRIGYNSAARLIERMESEGVVSKPNHAGKREVLARAIDEE
ncbi:DNA translocase FtsK [Azospirillum halopraeferens]|uniref:DNA translocase FtsK n=1 Tax=Azospirillum halopraeferens TaxID=34010 RepID=UPI00042548DF|nr:DNA translocase FtsK [Azospirillum halopraeferens]